MCIGTHPYIPAPETAETRLVYATPGGVAQNVLNWQQAGGFDAGQIADLAQSVSDAWETNLSTLASVDISLASVVATDISTVFGPQTDLPAGIAGAIGSSVLPSNVTLAISFRTGFRGRSFRGRAYAVGLTEGQVTGDSVSDAVATAYREHWEAFIASVQTDFPGASLAIVSRCQDGAWLTTATVTPVETVLVDPTVDSMRKRLKGRGI